MHAAGIRQGCGKCMDRVMDTPDLRPLTIGELLDRAIAVFVRNAGLFLLALAIIAIPPAVIEVIIAPHGFSAPFTALQQIIAHPNDPVLAQQVLKKSQAEQIPAFFASFLIYVAFQWELTAASIIAVDLFTGTAPSLRRALRLGLSRYLPAFVVSLGYVVVAFALVIALGIAIIPLALLVGLLGVVSKVLAIIVGIVLALVAIAAFIFFGSIASLSYLIAIVTVSTEDPNPIRAIGSGLRRTFARPLLVRSFLVGIALYLVRFGGSLLALGIGALLVAITRVDSLIVVPATVMSVLITGVAITFVARYTIDLRIRREGLTATPIPAVDAPA
jgi:hypothetical protein